MKKYESYKEDLRSDIHACIENMGCQPILFIGSGISQRYFGAPSWENLLKKMAENCPKINMPFAYYKQTKENLIDIGTEFTNDYLKWAWEDQTQFPQELFNTDATKDVYFKFKIAEAFNLLTPNSLDEVDKSFSPEIKALQSIRPHSIITTNYDGLLEIIFPEYTPIVGQKVLHSDYTSIGEIFKIHGCCTDCKSIVINSGDYQEFMKKKKYLSAKLLAYFAEHPLLFVGYNAEDPNIKAILSDIDELLVNDVNSLVPNIYFLEWNNELSEDSFYSREKPIILENGRSIRVKNIVADSFTWVFDAFSVENAIEKVNPKLLRALLARTYELVRTDIPRRIIDIDYKSLQTALNEDGSLAKIYGITSTNNPKAFNINFPYSLGDVAKKLGFTYWKGAQNLIERVEQEKGINPKQSDNKYHVSIKTSLKGCSRKYSDELVYLLEKVKSNDQYTVEI